MNIKTKDLVKTVDTKNIKDKADCFQRGDDWYEVEPTWDRKEKGNHMQTDCFGSMCFANSVYRDQYYKELEVTEAGKPVGYVSQESYARASSRLHYYKDIRPIELFLCFSIMLIMFGIIVYLLVV